MPKAPADIRSLARAHTKMAINTLVGIARETRAPAAARVSAATALLDRGWGKPEQILKNEGDNPISQTLMINASRTLDAKLERLINGSVDTSQEPNDP